MPALVLLFFFVIERSVLMALVFNNKGMSEKVTMQRTQQFSGFFNIERTQLMQYAPSVARKIETDCFCRNLPISNDPVIRISRNLAQK